jgi:hypothetical protein
VNNRNEDPEPAPYDGPEGGAATLLYTLEVDGEVFTVSARDGGTDYGWVSGPNTDYGFSSSGRPDMPREHHANSIRDFLRMIDPATGYIPDN